MSVPEEQPKPAEPAPSEETPASEEIFPEEPVLPEDFTPLGGTSRLPRARRRRAHRMLVPPGADERAALWTAWPGEPSLPSNSSCLPFLPG